jgi:ribonuclease HII
MDLWYFEKEATQKGCKDIAGIDEAGRGPLAGPVVSAAVILPATFQDPEITDSKKLSPKKRERLFDTIYDRAVAVGIGIVDPVEIDRINILQASLLAMAMAVENLKPQPDHLLIDGPFPIPSELSQSPKSPVID